MNKEDVKAMAINYHAFLLRHPDVLWQRYPAPPKPKYSGSFNNQVYASNVFFTSMGAYRSGSPVLSPRQTHVERRYRLFPTRNGDSYEGSELVERHTGGDLQDFIPRMVDAGLKVTVMRVWLDGKWRKQAIFGFIQTPLAKGTVPVLPVEMVE